MITLLVVCVVATAAMVLNLVVGRRRRDAPTTPRFAVPQQLDRSDFDGADSEWLLAVFLSETCLSCQDAWRVVGAVRGRSLTVQRLDEAVCRELHRRYGIDAVPTIVLADAEGVVRWSYLGAPPEEVINGTLDDLGIVPRDDGTSVEISR